jgi:hypothetical protein
MFGSNLLHSQKEIWLFPIHVAKGHHLKPPTDAGRMTFPAPLAAQANPAVSPGSVTSSTTPYNYRRLGRVTPATRLRGEEAKVAANVWRNAHKI